MTVEAHSRWIAQTMGHVTRQQLLPAAAHNFPELDRFHISCRAGSGRATYCKQQANGYVITYGRQMVTDKFQADTCRGWLTTREIVEHRYFDGELSPLNLLAHTLCHEFAHILQFLGHSGRRFNQRSHDQRFYRELDKLHQQGLADLCRQKLAARLEQRLDETLLNTVFTSNPVAQLKPALGTKIQFEHQSDIIIGRVIRRNRHTMTIAVEQQHGESHWRVPYHLASEVG